MSAASQIVGALLDFTVEILLIVVALIGEGVRRIYKHVRVMESRMGQVETELEISGDGKTRLERHTDRMDELQDTQTRLLRYMVGDENDPSDQGLLHEIKDTQEIVARIERELDINGALDHHRADDETDMADSD